VPAYPHPYVLPCPADSVYPAGRPRMQPGTPAASGGGATLTAGLLTPSSPEFTKTRVAAEHR